MLSISLGPIALPVAPVLLLLAVWTASWTATKLEARQARGAELPGTADAAGHAVFVAAVIGLLAARLAHLATNAGPHLASPGSMLDLRDGGWHPIAGGIAGAAWPAWRGRQMPQCRRPLAAAALAGMLVWSVGTLLIGARDSAAMPTTALETLEGSRPLDLRTAAAGRPVVVKLSSARGLAHHAVLRCARRTDRRALRRAQCSRARKPPACLAGNPLTPYPSNDSPPP